MSHLQVGPLTAEWLPDHGMVCASLRHDGGELLGRRGGLEAYLAKGSAFGIPLLHPWANRLSGLRYGDVDLDPERVKRDAAGLPKDGVMAGRCWDVLVQDATRLVATFEADEPVLAVFPFPHRLTVDVRLEPEAMTVTTTLAATGAVPVPVSFGWHPLFALPGVPRGELDVRLPAVRESVLDARGLPTGDERAPRFSGGPLGDRTLDDEYPEVDGDFVLTGGGRELTVAFGAPGYPVGHAWAPAGESFVAWEPMTAPTNALVSGVGLRTVQPGAQEVVTFTVAVRTVTD